ncbi:natterin-3-like [Brachyistius frenatus]|uniref:natterin-3-like n=1 Tax=Brachyistius frenatus TaxID=100188 RepID=UPI0037E8E0A1
MRLYLPVVITALVLAADHTCADESPADKADKPPPAYLLRVSKETTTEHQLIDRPEEPGPSARREKTPAFVIRNDTGTRSYGKPYTFNDNPNLSWKRYDGNLHSNAVGIWNDYTQRFDYVCTFNGCELGFYTSLYGEKCIFPRYPDLWSVEYNFRILVNKDDFVFLEWKSGSYGSVPPNSIRACTGNNRNYAGKNEYGLGSLHPEDSFYLPWVQSFEEGTVHGYSTWYRRSYQTLTINTDSYNQKLKDMEYFIDRANIVATPPFEVDQTTVINKDSSNATMTASLSSTKTKTDSWGFSMSTTLSISTTLTVGIPEIIDYSITIGVEQTFQASKETSISTSITTNLQIEVPVPPNTKCTIKMQGRRFTTDIPFKARLGRTYSNGDTKWTTIYGTYKGVQVTDYQAVIEPCEPLPNSSAGEYEAHVSDESSTSERTLA